MLIAIEGCTHGELEKIYETLAELERRSCKKIDLLICCGDFQAVRNFQDLKCMACPDKYKDMCSFYKYYSGEKEAPVLTLFIGGNHEASNYLQELPFGGWVAKNIFYMGYANVININGIRIGGISGIFNGKDYLSGRYELTPYNNSTQRSVYHLRNIDIFRFKQLAEHAPDIMLSHDWPRGIEKHGDLNKLLRTKQFLRPDIENNQLGSRPTMEVLQLLKPKYWFSAHLHVKFPALMTHQDGSQTRFLALDKCLPKRKFLQILEIGEAIDKESPIKLEYDPFWLAILKSTNHLMSVERCPNHMPGPMYKGKFDFKPTEEELDEIKSIFENDFTIKEANFDEKIKIFNPKTDNKKDLFQTQLPIPKKNCQTVWLCEKLVIDDPVDLILNRTWPIEEDDNEKKTVAQNKFEDVDEDESFSSFAETSINSTFNNDTLDEEDKNLSLTSSDLFTIDVKPNPDVSLNEPTKKKLKRRNQAIYATNNDEDN